MKKTFIPKKVWVLTIYDDVESSQIKLSEQVLHANTQVFLGSNQAHLYFADYFNLSETESFLMWMDLMEEGNLFFVSGKAYITLKEADLITIHNYGEYAP